MASLNGKPVGRPPHRNSRHGPYAPSDALQGGWTRVRLEAMNARFVKRMRWAISRGKESAGGKRRRRVLLPKS
jgi:hypothetical protein